MLTETEAAVQAAPPAVGELDSASWAVRSLLEDLGLAPVPGAAVLFGIGAGAWLHWDPRGLVPVLRGLHPDRLQRTFFSLDVWAIRSRILSADAPEYVAGRIERGEPALVEVDLGVLLGAPRHPGSRGGQAVRVVGAERGGHGEPARFLVAVAGGGEPLRVEAPRFREALYRPAPDGFACATVYEPLVRRLQLDEAPAVERGLRRFVGQMRQTLPALGVTGLRAFEPFRAALAAGGPRLLADAGAVARPDGGEAFFRDLQSAFLSRAAEGLGSPALAAAAARFAESAEIWRELLAGGCRDPLGAVDAVRGREEEGVRQVALYLEGPRAAWAATAPAAIPATPAGLGGYRHLRGVHCVSMSLRNLSAHYAGVRWSEALCFGLGAGLNFTYLREPGSPFFLCMGRGSDMEEHFADALGIHLEIYRSQDGEVAWEHLRSLLDRGLLAVIEADMFHLPYMVQSLGLMPGVHFGGHKLLPVGHDPARGTVDVCDYAWAPPFTLSREQLGRARGSRECPEPPSHRCFVFRFPEPLTPLTEAVPMALRTMVRQMRYPFLHFNGLPAIEKFCRQVARWGRVMKGEELRVNTELTAFMLEKAGTGGGNFRNLYHRFLREAADLLEAPGLEQAAGTYRRLAGAWREVAALLGEAAADPRRGMYDPAGPQQLLLDEVAALEQRGVEEIDAFLRGRRPPGREARP